MVNDDAMAARLEASFDTDVYVRELVRTPRPSGGHTVSHGVVVKTLRGRARLYDPTLDADVAAGKESVGTVYIVTLPRHSGVVVGQRINVVNRHESLRLDVTGRRTGKSVYLADYFSCVAV